MKLQRWPTKEIAGTIRPAAPEGAAAGLEPAVAGGEGQQALTKPKREAIRKSSPGSPTNMAEGGCPENEAAPPEGEPSALVKLDVAAAEAAEGAVVHGVAVVPVPDGDVAGPKKAAA